MVEFLFKLNSFGVLRKYVLEIYIKSIRFNRVYTDTAYKGQTYTLIFYNSYDFLTIDNLKSFQ